MDWKTMLLISIFPNFIYNLNTIPIKIPASYVVDNNTLILKFTWKPKDTVLQKTGVILPDFKASIECSRYWQKN